VIEDEGGGAGPYAEGMPQLLPPAVAGDLRLLVKAQADELVALRRDLHAHPELGRSEVRSTRLVSRRLAAEGLAPATLPGGTGLVCDIGSGPLTVALRADLDALPVQDVKDVPYRSTVDGVCHACGHDVHTAAVLGAGLALAALAHEGRLPGRVRLLFQPAEEMMPGGALDAMRAGVLDGVQRIFALHCDPRLEVGAVGLRRGAITGSSDRVRVRLTGRGGHTARPHLTADLVYALAKVVTDVPAALSRRVDPRSGLSLVWGRVDAGSAANAIPRVGEAEGTLRSLDGGAWEQAPALVEQLVRSVADAYGARAEVFYDRGVPPVVNDVASTEILRAATLDSVGPDAARLAEQSLGGEDFAWYLERVPGALARLGVAAPGQAGAHDLHMGDFDVDERSVALGSRLLAATALLALDPDTRDA
jgi:amidohydrolase